MFFSKPLIAHHKPVIARVAAKTQPLGTGQIVFFLRFVQIDGHQQDVCFGKFGVFHPRKRVHGHRHIGLRHSQQLCVVLAVVQSPAVEVLHQRIQKGASCRAKAGGRLLVKVFSFESFRLFEVQIDIGRAILFEGSGHTRSNKV